MMRRTLLLLAVAALAVVPAARAEKMERLEIVDRALQFHGGRTYWNSEVRLEMCSKSGCQKLRSKIYDGVYLFEAETETRRVTITNDTVQRWEDGSEVTVAPDDEQSLRDWVMARIYFTFLPQRLNDPSVFKEDLGLETWEGRELQKVKVTFAAGSSTHAQDEYLYWFDPDTARLEQFAYSYATGGGGLRFRKTVAHRKLGGIRFFDQENFGVDGPGLSVDLITPRYAAESMRHVSTVRLDQIQILEPQ